MNASIFAVANKFNARCFGMNGEGDGVRVSCEEDASEYGYLQADIQFGDVVVTLEQSRSKNEIVAFAENSLSGESKEYTLSQYGTGDLIDYLQYVVSKI
jgi:hypothetical protein